MRARGSERKACGPTAELKDAGNIGMRVKQFTSKEVCSHCHGNTDSSRLSGSSTHSNSAGAHAGGRPNACAESLVF